MKVLNTNDYKVDGGRAKYWESGDLKREYQGNDNDSVDGVQCTSFIE